MEQLRTVWQFAWHIVVGMALFVLVGLAAYVLHHFADWLAQAGLSEFIVLPIRGLEFLLFAIDFVLALVYIFREAVLFMRSLFRSA